jgi:O-antigen ligase
MCKAAFGIFLFILIFSPVAFGTVEQWSLTIMEGASFLALCVLALSAYRRKEGLYSVPGALPLALLLLYAIIQIVPLPPWVVRAISPGTFSLYESTIGVVEPPGWVSLSINRRATLLEFFRLASYASFYFVTVQLLTRKDLLKKAAGTAVVLVALISLAALFQFILTGDRIFFFREVPENAHPFGPYVNRNHYAGLVEMVFPLALSIFLFYLPAARYVSFRERLSGIFSEKSTNVHLLGFSILLMATTTFLSQSRAGAVSMVLSAVFFFLLLARATGERRFVLMPTFLLVLLSVGWFGWDPIVARFGKALSAEGVTHHLRPLVWIDSLQIITDFPLTGAGIGSFSSIYPAYRHIEGSENILLHAHNDYIELAAEGGLIAMLLTGWFLLSVIRNSYASFRKRRDIYSIYLTIGGFTGILAILLHSITDFNTHIGANGLYFFFLLGFTVSAANTRLRLTSDSTYLKKTNLPARNLSYAAGAALLACLVFNLGVLAGELRFNKAENTYIAKSAPENEIVSLKETAAGAAAFDPLEARYHYAAANSELLLSNKTAAFERLWKSVRLDPSNAEYLQQFGFVLSGAGRHEEAEGLLEAGIRYDYLSRGKDAWHGDHQGSP